MKLSVTLHTVWTEEYFEKTLRFKNQMQSMLPNFLPETIEDYKKLFHPSSPFMQDHFWVGIEISSGEKTVGNAILGWRKISPTGNLGFIDWINDPEVASLLIKEVEIQALKNGLTQLKTPIDLNFFIRYRIKLPGGGEAFHGEPIYPDYYHELFKATGFSEVGYWSTYRVKPWQFILNFTKKRKKMSDRKYETYEKMSSRSIQLNNWENELRLTYELFSKAYAKMPEFESVTFDQFKVVYDDFKYIINPWYALIVEMKGSPVGFCINYPDPLSILRSVSGRSLNTWQKVLTLLRLKLNLKTLLVPHIGKVPGPNGEEIKGLQIKLSKSVGFKMIFFNRVLFCYQAAASPSRRALDGDIHTPYSAYVLYGKNLE